MATLLFVLLHALKDLHGPYNTAIFCLLLALDSNTALRWWLWKQSGR